MPPNEPTSASILAGMKLEQSSLGIDDGTEKDAIERTTVVEDAGIVTMHSLLSPAKCVDCDDGGDAKKKPPFSSPGNRSEFRFFIKMMCAEGVRSWLLLFIGVVCALLSGCAPPVLALFAGRVVQILLLTVDARRGATVGALSKAGRMSPTGGSSSSSSTAFRMQMHEQICILAAVSLAAIVAHFCLHLSCSILGHRVVANISSVSDELRERLANLRPMRKHISDELLRDIQSVREGCRSVHMLVRSAAVLLAAAVIAFAHDYRLSFAMLAAVPLCVGVCALFRKLTQLASDINRGKIARATQMEKEMVLLRDVDDTGFNDERLLRFSEELHRSSHYSVLEHVWEGAYSGVLCFILFTFVGCGMLFGSYLFEMEIVRSEGDVFVVVLSMALVAHTICAFAAELKRSGDGATATLRLASLQRNPLDKAASPLAFHKLFESSVKRPLGESVSGCSSDGGSVSDRLSGDRPSFRGTTRVFLEGTARILKNNHNDRLHLTLGVLLAIVYGLKLPIFTLLLGHIFSSMFEPSEVMMKHLVVYTVAFSCAGFVICVITTLGAALLGVVAEHMAIGFRVNLVRYYSRPSANFNNNNNNNNSQVDDVEEVVNRNITQAGSAKSLYHPLFSIAIRRITSITANAFLGFVYSWQIALLGAGFALLCLFIEAKLLNSSNNSEMFAEGSPKGRSVGSLANNVILALHFVVQRCSCYVIVAMCAAFAAFLLHSDHVTPNEAFMSVMAMAVALREVLVLPELAHSLISACNSALFIFSKVVTARSPL